MGFRSTFVTQEVAGVLPDWFVEKWKDWIHFRDGNQWPLATKNAGK